MSALILTGAVTADGARRDLEVRDGRIARVAAPGALGAEAGAGAGATLLDLGGAVVLPAFVDGHIHLDKSFVGTSWRPHEPQETLAGRIAAEARALREVERELPLAERALRLVDRVVAHGTGALRSHVDVHPDVGVSAVEAVVDVARRCADRVDVQVVAFPQRGVIASPGTAELLDAALRAGADVVGGLDPAGFDGDVEGQLTTVFDLAERHGAMVDIHLHDDGALGTFQLRRIARHAADRGLAGRVAVSHAYALGAVDADELARTAEQLAAADVAIMTNAPGTGTMPPVLTLRAAGVTVFAGNDNVRDAWWPYGSGDMLERAMLIGYRQGLYTDEELGVALAMATTEAAGVLGLEGYGLHEGARANLVAVDARTPAEAVACPGARLLVLHDGRVVGGTRAADGAGLTRSAPAAR
ncbi:MAG TPA: amidohydrolase family protein [Baekduia sp.]|uniref:amidohydrolase family protein n=1 Tax=Baekduia sp. TaxID=2600305 RepID=UPI002D7917E9|nr:amidohydrolase family protein [Baekduia sp.]HET6509717.1 amidohydrolase family protein [Baekduia sp.]